MKQVFVDTSGFYAFTDADDEFHEKSRTLFEKAAAESWRLTTTNYVEFFYYLTGFTPVK